MFEIRKQKCQIDFANVRFLIQVLVKNSHFRICQKFLVHSQDIKAESFRKLVNLFLENPAFEDKPKVSSRFCLLSFTSVKYEDKCYVSYFSIICEMNLLFAE